MTRTRFTISALASAAGIIGWQTLSGPVLVLAVLLAIAVGVGMSAVGWHRRNRTVAVVRRWGATSRRKHGVASTVDVARAWVANRRKATTVRPSLAGLTRWQRLRLPATEYAVPLCRVGALPVAASVEDVVCVFGGPRTGKTGWLAGRVIDAPGAVLVTSTRTDLYDLTSGLRAKRGPVFVFNAVGLADAPSTITFDPLQGCADPTVAVERAIDLLAAGSTGGGGDREYWVGQAQRVLAALLHAAALGGLHMRDVLGWVADPDTAQREITSLLRQSTEPSYEQAAIQWITTNDRTRSSITSTVMPALSWLTSPPAVAATTGGRPLDVAELVRDRATVYLLGAEEAQSAPLLSALTGHIAREARRIAAKQPGGRLDPPLTLALDEAALICPIPLDSLSADMGGRGVTIIPAFQSRAQMMQRWGEHGAAIIMNNTGSVMLFGGTKDEADLRHWSALAGERDEPVETLDAAGNVTSRSVRKTPVFAAAQLANLPPWRVVVFRRGMPVAVGRVRPAWKRRDVKAQLAHEARTTRDAAAAVVAEAERVTAHTAATPPAPARWAVDPNGITHRACDPSNPAALNGRAHNHQEGTGDATH